MMRLYRPQPNQAELRAGATPEIPDALQVRALGGGEGLGAAVEH